MKKDNLLIYILLFFLIINIALILESLEWDKSISLGDIGSITTFGLLLFQYEQLKLQKKDLEESKKRYIEEQQNNKKAILILEPTEKFLENNWKNNTTLYLYNVGHGPAYSIKIEMQNEKNSFDKLITQPMTFKDLFSGISYEHQNFDRNRENYDFLPSDKYLIFKLPKIVVQDFDKKLKKYYEDNKLPDMVGESIIKSKTKIIINYKDLNSEEFKKAEFELIIERIKTAQNDYRNKIIIEKGELL
ncbi:hypothetical protein C8C76_1474 [Halanaerobium saccharolyticum]|jgi:hypothetical protein|uniref:Uncharacterized protein n=1 Tax=Halanaerobium saccharolyticum TaxID=43595 RepID=A0A2T5RFV5_9FIRM|nr:hypothetical protein [Halanaerobium saccharolyticum]PTV93209.1 hypothetical protein C8C76_1474 [Halanaerobium saccharolyticum]